MSDSPKQRMNKLGKAKIPFLFIVDFDMKKPIIIPLNEVDASQIMYSINDKKNYTESVIVKKNVEFNSQPVEKSRYSKAFNLVQKHIRHGDSFLLNLTMPSNINTNLSPREIFYSTSAKYKIWFKDNFVVYSPEIFVQTQNGKIHSFPMKGTIMASVPNARKKLLESEKELAEHYTIVDLIRNDLSIVAKNVRVERFRYIEKVQTHKGALLQMSSEIVGELPSSFTQNIGDMIFSMLPAGSISGAPKRKTIEAIKQAENYDRGYYTGICGIFDGENIDSGVMIRYVEQTNDGLMYKSGGGITAKSNLDEEYQELMDKIYIPFNL
jgi:para-aminobenzoate synthetase component 1